jgi:hypothetical protein
VLAVSSKAFGYSPCLAQAQKLVLCPHISQYLGIWGHNTYFQYLFGARGQLQSFWVFAMPCSGTEIGIVSPYFHRHRNWYCVPIFPEIGIVSPYFPIFPIFPPARAVPRRERVWRRGRWLLFSSGSASVGKTIAGGWVGLEKRLSRYSSASPARGCRGRAAAGLSKSKGRPLPPGRPQQGRRGHERKFARARPRPRGRASFPRPGRGSTA